MYYFLFLILFILLSFLYALYVSHKKSKATEKKIASAFGQRPSASSSSLTFLQKTWQEKLRSSQEEKVDTVTWNDLGMDDIFLSINSCLSTPGEELLYANLRKNTPLSEEQVDHLEAFQLYFTDHPDMRLRVQSHLYQLGKSTDTNLNDLFDHPDLFTPYFPALTSILSFAPLLALPLIFFSPKIALFYFIVSALLNLFIFSLFYKHLQGKLHITKYLGSFLFASKRILRFLPLDLLPQGKEAKKHFSAVKKVASRFSALNQEVMQDQVLGIMSAFIRYMFLRPAVSYNKSVRVLLQNPQAVAFLYQYIGQLDIAISLASFRKSLPYYCSPTYTEEITLSGEKLYHPLLPGGVANDLDFHSNVILTGSNASGKSTFIKAIAVNALLAHSLNTCCAKEFSLPGIPVYTSMAISDSLLHAESYFVAEIKSIKRIIDKLKETPCLCFIDEILRGTNTVERIAASSAVLSALQTYPSFCIVATHDIELTTIFQDSYHFYHFRETIQEEEIHFDYTLYPGPSTSKNAINLLALFGFDPQIIHQAKYLANYFEENQQWLSFDPLAEKSFLANSSSKERS
ncbi:MAG: hypothetical protein GX786_00995 [Clostridiales bacterium]|nr:hypothetical protein [Clostridiales bacterium]